MTAESIVPGNSPVFSQDVSPPTDRIIIRMKEGQDALADKSQRNARLQSLSVQAGMEIGYARSMSGRAHVLQLQERLPEQAMRGIIQRLKHDPHVEDAEPDAIMQSMRIPNDTFYNSYQWHYQDSSVEPGSVNLPAAWDVTTGSSSVVVGVIDTGILPHADLVGRTLPGYDFISTAFVGNDGNGRDADPTDPGDWTAYGECYSASPVSYSSWHGTHVAGTIGAASNNGYGVAGVNWNSRIVPARVLGKCGGYTSDIADAVRWTAGLPVSGVPLNANPAQVINMSLGGAYTCGATSAMQLAINDAVANGAVVVVAAGNSSMDASGYSPAGCNNVVAVTANNRAGSRAYYSNYGPTVEIAAPGGESPLNPGGILSTLDTGSTSAAGDNVFAFYQGTSMAAPHVAGVVSLMASAHHSLSGSHLSSSVLMDKLLGSARPFPTGSTCNTSLCGAGIADATRAVAAVTTAPMVDAGADQNVDAGQVVVLEGLANDDGAVTSVQWLQVSGPAVTLNGSGTSTSFTAGSESATLTFELVAVDDIGLSASDAVTVDVVAQPVVEPEPTPDPAPEPAPEPVPAENSVPVASDLALVTEKNTPVSAMLAATDADGDNLGYQIVSAPANGSVTLDATTGTITYTPARRYTGADSFTFVVSDGVDSSAPATVSITVNGGTKGGGKTGSDSTKGGRKK